MMLYKTFLSFGLVVVHRMLGKTSDLTTNQMNKNATNHNNLDFFVRMEEESERGISFSLYGTNEILMTIPLFQYGFVLTRWEWIQFDIQLLGNVNFLEYQNGEVYKTHSFHLNTTINVSIFHQQLCDSQKSFVIYSLRSIKRIVQIYEVLLQLEQTIKSAMIDLSTVSRSTKTRLINTYVHPLVNVKRKIVCTIIDGMDMLTNAFHLCMYHLMWIYVHSYITCFVGGNCIPLVTFVGSISIIIICCLWTVVKTVKKVISRRTTTTTTGDDIENQIGLSNNGGLTLSYATENDNIVVTEPIQVNDNVLRRELIAVVIGDESTTGDNMECSICFGDLTRQNISNINGCNHQFCFDCICQWLNMNDNSCTCPNCRSEFTKITRVHK